MERLSKAIRGAFFPSFEDLSGSEDSRALAFWATAGPLSEVILAWNVVEKLRPSLSPTLCPVKKTAE